MKKRSKIDLKRCVKIAGLLLGITVALSAQQSDNRIYFKYSYQPSGIMPSIYNQAVGFDKFTPDSQNPIEFSYPVSIPIIKIKFESSSDGNHLIQFEQLGNENYIRIPVVQSFTSYYKSKKNNISRNLWKEKVTKNLSAENTKKKESSIEIIGADIAGQRVSLRVMGNISISGKLNNQTQSAQVTNFSQRDQSNFILDQTQNFNIEGRIGDRISIKVDQDSERDFNFENTLKIFYTGEEDEIIQKIDAGNIGLSLPATRFVTGKANSTGLFGIKALLKVGPVDITTIASVEEGQNKKVSWGGGSESEAIIIKDNEYKKNKYFFINKSYRAGMYPLDEQGRFTIERLVLDFELYKSVTDAQDNGAFEATAWNYPNEPGSDTNDSLTTYFKRLERNKDYILNENLGYFKLLTFVQSGDILAITYKDTALNSGALYPSYQEGDLLGIDSLVTKLKLIKPESPRPSDETWNLEFKNVYYLGAQNINEDGFELKIFNSTIPSPIDRDPQSGVSYLQTFELDKMDESGNYGISDEIIDTKNPAVLSLSEGELWIPFLRPFTSEKTINNPGIPGEFNPNIPEDLSSHALYDTTSTQYISSDSKFYIEVKYANRSSEIQLKDFMIIEDSEELTVGGKRLVKGIDYTIDYFSGRITLISQEALSPNAELEISYNSRQMFQLDKKTIAGMRAEYKFGKSNFFGTTFMYYSKSSIDDQVRVGEEPFRNLIWDINGQMKYDIGWLTRGINALPLISTHEMSSFKMEGEIAQIIPNPNTISNEKTGDYNGVANVDDFEGAKQTTPLGVERKGWYPASRPANDSLSYGQQGFLFWYNPWNDVPTNQIWPDKEVSSQMQNNLTRTMIMVLDPDTNGITGHPNTDGLQSTWGGIMRSLYSGAWDQSESKYIEIWAKGEKGTIRIDLGKISEDIDMYDPLSGQLRANGKLDTEDKPLPGTGNPVGNGILEDEENIGLNGLTDDEEISLGLNPLIDNYDYTTQTNYYRYINGTEENKDYYFPDTEDINGNNRLDIYNDYFTYELNLENTPYFVTETIINGSTPTGWKLYRIPLTEHIETVGDALISDIQAVRLLFTNVSDQDSVQIASIGLVGNEWQELGVAEYDSTDFFLDDNIFKITVINNEDNPEYESPKGVLGKLDPLYNIRAKEQSLAMNINDLKPGYRTAAKKVLWDSENYMNYQEMKMFVHGDLNYFPDSVQTTFYIKMGYKSGESFDNYYEIKTPIYAGWNEKNFIEFDFASVTALKQILETSEDSVYVISHDGLKREHFIQDNNGEFTGQVHKVVGEPSFSRINYFEIGVENTSDDNYTGDIWINEMRVSNPLREKGMAFRGLVDLNLAGLASISVNGQYKDANFHQVDQQYATTGSTDNLKDASNLNVTLRLNPHKLLPKKWNLSLPINLTYSENKSIPIYVPGSDILLNTVPDSIKTLSNKVGISTSFKKNSKSEFWLTKYTIDKVSGSFSATDNTSSNKNIRLLHTTTYNGKVSYSINFPKGEGLSYLKWFPVYGQKLEKHKFFIKPTAFSYNVNMRENNKSNEPRTGNLTENYTLNMDRSLSFSYNPFKSVQASYKKNMKNNLDDYKGRKADIIKDMDTGFPQSENETYSLSYSPEIAKIFKPKFTYTSGFNLSNQINLPYSGTSNNRNMSSSFTLDPKKIVGLFDKKSTVKKTSSRKPKSSRPSSRGKSKEEADKLKKGGKATKPKKEPFSFKKMLTGSVSKISPIQFNVSQRRSLSNQGVMLGDTSSYHRDPVNLMYRMGFSDSPADSIVYDIVGNNAVKTNTTQDFSIRSGIKFTSKLSSTINYKISHTINESGITTNENMSRGFLPLGDTGEDGFPMFDWSVKWTGLNKIKYIEKYVKNLTFNHAYSGSEKKTLQNGDIKNFNYSMSFQPLLGMVLAFKNGIQTNLNYTKKMDILNETNDTRKTYSDNGSFTLTYSHKGGMHIPLPFMEDMNMQNNISISMTATYSKSDVFQRKISGGKFERMNWNDSWKIRPDINYQFSKNINGSIFYMYGESSTPTNPKRITRDYGLKVDIRIRG